MWAGLWAVEVAPSPNVQDQLVGLPVELSVKATLSGTVPDVGVPLNDAVGGNGAALTAPVPLSVNVAPSTGRNFQS